MIAISTKDYLVVNVEKCTPSSRKNRMLVTTSTQEYEEAKGDMKKISRDHSNEQHTTFFVYASEMIPSGLCAFRRNYYSTYQNYSFAGEVTDNIIIN